MFFFLVKTWIVTSSFWCIYWEAFVDTHCYIVISGKTHWNSPEFFGNYTLSHRPHYKVLHLYLGDFKFNHHQPSSCRRPSNERIIANCCHGNCWCSSISLMVSRTTLVHTEIVYIGYNKYNRIYLYLFGYLVNDFWLHCYFNIFFKPRKAEISQTLPLLPPGGSNRH